MGAAAEDSLKAVLNEVPRQIRLVGDRIAHGAEMPICQSVRAGSIAAHRAGRARIHWVVRSAVLHSRKLAATESVLMPKPLGAI